MRASWVGHGTESTVIRRVVSGRLGTVAQRPDASTAVLPRKSKKGRLGETVFADDEGTITLLPYSEAPIRDTIEAAEKEGLMAARPPVPAELKKEESSDSGTESDSKRASSPSKLLRVLFSKRSEDEQQPSAPPQQPSAPPATAALVSEYGLPIPTTRAPVPILPGSIDDRRSSARRWIAAWKGRANPVLSEYGLVVPLGRAEASVDGRPVEVRAREARAWIDRWRRRKGASEMRPVTEEEEEEEDGGVETATSGEGQGQGLTQTQAAILESLKTRPRSPQPASSASPLLGMLSSALLVAAAVACTVAMDRGVLPVGDPFAGGATQLLLSSAAASAVAVALGMPLLRAAGLFKKVRVDGPPAHAAKQGTPTAAGLLFLPPALILGLMASSGPHALPVAVAAVLFGVIGAIDDLVGVRSGKGMPAPVKLAAQVAAAAAACYTASTALPPLGSAPELALFATATGVTVLAAGPLLYYAAGAFAMVACSNGVNLADGLDGLAAGTGAAACLGCAAALGGPVAPLLVALAGGCLGFLAHNAHPARAFMGDAGALAIGGAIGSVAVATGHLGAVAVACGVFVAEAVSVMAQVGVFKATKGSSGQGRRLFRMAPLHHHFELGGTPEPAVTAGFWAAGVACAALAVKVAGGLPAVA